MKNQTKSVVCVAAIVALVALFGGLSSAGGSSSVSSVKQILKNNALVAIVRTERKGGKESASLYLGEGSSLSYGKHQIAGDSSKQGYKLFPAE